MDYLKIAEELVLEVDKKIKRTYWTNKEIDLQFGKRSAKEIIKSGHTFFMNPCLDITLVSSYILNQKKIPHKWIIEEHLPTKDFDFNRLHFVLELKKNDKLYVLNYKKLNEVYIYKGKYNGREDIPRAQIIKINGKKINPNKPLYKNFGYKNLEKMLRDKFKDYSLEKNITRLKQDNSKENYELFKKIYGNKFQINLIK